MQRLPHCFTKWRGAEFGNIVAHIRFHPRGEIASGSVIAPVRDQENPPGMVIGHVPVPFEGCSSQRRHSAGDLVS